jgi:GT2 family glycosyltransferase
MTLLAKPYSSGNRIETDHCLSIRRTGLKVMYNPRMVARHLAKPRPDMSEVSLRWHLNSIRNTIYLFLKHYGLFGNGGVALRVTFLQHVGIVSAVRHPSRANLAYFLNGLRARASAYGHYFLYLSGPRFDSPEAFTRILEADTAASAPGTLAGAAAPRGR